MEIIASLRAYNKAVSAPFTKIVLQPHTKICYYGVECHRYGVECYGVEFPHIIVPPCSDIDRTASQTAQGHKLGHWVLHLL